MIGIYAARNHRERAGHPKAVISMGGHHECVRIHYILHRVSIIGTVVKSPVEGHGGHISDCAGAESDPVLTNCTVQILLHRCLDLILVHCLQVIYFACYKYFLTQLLGTAGAVGVGVCTSSSGSVWPPISKIPSPSFFLNALVTFLDLSLAVRWA